VREPHLNDLYALLKRVRVRWTLTRVVRASARAAGVVGAALLVVLLADSLFKPADLPLLGLAAAGLASALAWTGWALWPLRYRPSDRQVARFVEERCPELEDRLVSATEVAERSPDSVFRELMLADAAARARDVDIDRVVAGRDLRRSIARGAVLAGALVVLLAVGFQPVSRILRLAWLYALPNTMMLEVEPGDAALMAGQPLRIQARLRGGIGAPGRTMPRLTVWSPRGERTIEMRPSDRGFVAEFPAVTESFAYRVTAGGVASAEYVVRALVAPRVEGGAQALHALVDFVFVHVLVRLAVFVH